MASLVAVRKHRYRCFLGESSHRWSSPNCTSKRIRTWSARNAITSGKALDSSVAQSATMPGMCSASKMSTSNILASPKSNGDAQTASDAPTVSQWSGIRNWCLCAGRATHRTITTAWTNLSSCPFRKSSMTIIKNGGKSWGKGQAKTRPNSNKSWKN